MLWVFGDSYSADSRYMDKNPNIKSDVWPIEKNWIEQLTENLYGDVQQRKVFCEYGASNEWIFFQLTTAFNQISEGDYVIVQLSSASRRWFFKDRPHLSNILSTVLEEDRDISKDEIDAIEMYIRYLHSDHQDFIFYKAFVLSIDYIALQLFEKNVKMLILPGFHNIEGVVGNLGDICFNEFSNKNTRKLFYQSGVIDPRMNHISEDNHKILSDKIYNFFTNGVTVDLTQGFRTKFLNEKMFSVGDRK